MIRDSLAVWARRLGKSARTVRRYVQKGIIPDGYQTPGGQWRAPFSEDALVRVKENIRPFVRERATRPSFGDYPGVTDSLRYRNLAHISRIAFAANVANNRIKLDERLLWKFESLALTGRVDAMRIDEEYRSCIPTEEDIRITTNNKKEVALYAAVLYALIDIDAEGSRATIKSVSETAKDCAMRRFGEIAQFTGSQRPIQRMRKVNWILPYWQQVVGRRPKSAGQEAAVVDGAVQWPTKYLSQRTFQRWYSADKVDEAVKNGQQLL